MENIELKKLIDNLIREPKESEWIEFKHNFHSEKEIGERLSALSNSASIHNKNFAYLVFGVEDETHKIIGTTFSPKHKKIGNEELENWLVKKLVPKIDFRIHELDYEGMHIALFEIPASNGKATYFENIAYVRVGSYTRKLLDFPDKESKIWKKNLLPFEQEIAKKNVAASDVIQLLSTEAYFDLIKIPYPSSQQGVIEKFIAEGIVLKDKSTYHISKLGAILFAKNLSEFDGLERKSVRVIVYRGRNKVETVREQIGVKGYAVGFEGLVDWINSQLPANEEIGKALRKETRMYPEIAIRELVANALIHQDFSEKGFPMIEIYSDRIEISNPGLPLINADRFIDEYISRNDKLADLMRRMGFCEEKGSGLDKVIYLNEIYQLPGINVIIGEKRTRVTLYSYLSLNELDKKDKIRATYQHACLKYVSNEKMTNQSLRERFKIDSKNSAIASRIIRDAVEEGVIKEEDPDSKSRKFAGYLPYWA